MIDWSAVTDAAFEGGAKVTERARREGVYPIKDGGEMRYALPDTGASA